MDFTEELPVEYNLETFDAAFNPQYIIDVLKNVGSEKVTFSFEVLLMMEDSTC